MSAIVLSDCFISIDDTEFSGQNTNVAISFSAAAVDVTAMGDDTKITTGGIKDWSIAMDFIADEAVTGDLFAMVGTTVAVEVRATSGARSATNPGYMGRAVVTEYTPISGNVGDAHKVSLTVVSAGALSRNVTPDA